MKTHRKSFKNKLGLWRGVSAAATLAAVVSFAAAPAARAQDTATLPTQNVSITLSDAPVRTALDGLFKSTSLNYTIDPNIQENVTVTLHNVPFEVALKTILRSSTPELRYSVSDGVYKIYAPAADQANQSIPSAGTPQTGYPGANGITGGPNIGYGPGANTGLNASTTDTKQLVLIKLTYAPGQLLNAVIGPVQIIQPQLYTPGANTSGTGSTSGGIGGNSGGGISGGGVSSGGLGGGGFSGGSSFGR